MRAKWCEAAGLCVHGFADTIVVICLHVVFAEEVVDVSGRPCCAGGEGRGAGLRGENARVVDVCVELFDG